MADSPQNTSSASNIPKRKKTLSEIRALRSEAGKKGAAVRITRLREGSVRDKMRTEKLIKDIERENLEQFYMRGIRKVATAQMALAQGLTFLYVIRTDKKGNRSRPEVITEQSTIEDYLAGELNDEDNEYYFLATKDPHNEALKNIQDRVFGKPTETQVLDVNHNFSLVSLDARRDMLRLTPDAVQILPPPAQ